MTIKPDANMTLPVLDPEHIFVSGSETDQVSASKLLTGLY